MKLVVGLGNPGRRYEGTRHNVGYAILAELARRYGLTPPKAKFHGEVVEAELGGQKALLLSPTTFMNRSGTSVQEAMSFYKLPNEEMLVLCDDLNLPVGKLRFRAGGSSGGQKGLDDIIAKTGNGGVCAAARRHRRRAGRLGLGRLRVEQVYARGVARDRRGRGAGGRRRGRLGPRGHRVLHESI